MNFLIPRLTPGNPIRERLYTLSNSGGINQAAIEEMVCAYDKDFGFHQPLVVQYVRYLWNIAHLDFGYSMAQFPAKVLPLILGALPWTIGLPLAATLLLGLVLVYAFAVTWKIFPLSGGYTAGMLLSLTWPFVIDVLSHAVLPALSIVLAAVGFWALGMRRMMITNVGEEYMIMAHAKGLPGYSIFSRYAVRNAVLPQITTLAIALGHVVSGAILVEVVFGLNALVRGLWWWWVAPSAVIVVLFVGLFLVSTGLDELANPRLRSAP